AANFYHFKITLLSGTNLINALRTLALRTDTSYVYRTMNYEFSTNNGIAKLSLLKCAFFCFMVGYTVWILTNLNVANIFIILSVIIEGVVFVFVWWRDLLYRFTLRNMRNNAAFFKVNPFENIEFYRFKDIPDAFFAHIDHKVLLTLKSFNLSFASPKLHSKEPICNLDKFLRGALIQRLNFTYTMLMAPVSYYTFHKEGFKYLNDYTKQWIINNRKKLNNEKDAKDWLGMRSGIWKVIMIVSAFSLKHLNLLKKKHIYELKEELDQKANELWKVFSMNFDSFDIVALYDKHLISGYLCESLKNKFFRLNGTHLNYLLFQGKALVQLTEIASEFKKGIETQIAAEFNSPLLLENDITIGNTINTEFLEEEVPAGLLINQVKHLLIVNGTFEDRELLVMKIVAELLVSKPLVHSIIFDFSGRWSKLIKLFEGSFYENEFLYFKAGVNYSVDVFKSDIPYDQDNLEYLDYIFDVCALSFKKDKRTMEMFQNLILSNPEMDISTLSMQLRSRQEWERNHVTNNVVSLLDGLTQKDSVFFHSLQPENSNKITVHDFITKDKTIIIDLSLSKDYETQLFLSFIIISKIIHQLRDSDEFYKKIIVLPHMDLFFNSFYLDQRANYGKIDKFLDPLIQKGFGLIISANQVHDLHPNVYNYFDNIITFKATDKRDISVLKNQLKLDQDFGKGYYSATRNATYQINYLLGLHENIAIMKRDDIHQPFPIKIKTDQIQKTPAMEYDEIMRHMSTQGYDLTTAEQNLLKNTKKTIFEKDFKNYAAFIDEVIVFLKALSEVHDIAIYKKKIKQELKKCIEIKAKKITKDKIERKNIRDRLFEILLRQKYLVENHPKTASGSESLGTSYSIGPHFQTALNDYYQTKRSYPTEVKLESIERASTRKYNLQHIFKDETKQKQPSKEDIYAKCISELYYELFRIYKYINKKDFMSALRLEKQFFRTFIENLYDQLIQQNYLVPYKDEFIEYLITQLKFPFTKDEFITLVQECKSLDLSEGNIEGISRHIYEKLSEFFNRIQLQVSEV
ncbi:MAG: hypothetical protein ACFFAS_21255, partial [Promethearchaeota archaeon]